MKNKTLLLFISILLISFSCEEKGKNQETAADEVIYVNKLKRADVKQIPDEYIENTEYIKLVAESDDLLIREITKAIISDNNIYIHDDSQNKIFVYDITGKGLATIGTIGNGPNEYLNVSDFDVTKDGEIYFIDGQRNKLFIYGSNNEFVSSNTLPFEADIIKIINDGNILFGLSSWNKGENEGTQIIAVNKDIETVNKIGYFDKNIDNDFWISLYSFSQTNNSIQYNKPINNTVFQISKEGELEKTICFDFGSNEIPDDKKRNIEANIKSFKNYNMLKWATIVESNWALGHFWEGTKTKPFFIDRKNNKLFVLPETNDIDLSNLIGYSNYTIIKSIMPGSNNAKESYLPKDVKEHLEGDDYVISLQKLYHE